MSTIQIQRRTDSHQKKRGGSRNQKKAILVQRGIHLNLANLHRKKRGEFLIRCKERKMSIGGHSEEQKKKEREKGTELPR